jgi:hypothetical protein
MTALAINYNELKRIEILGVLDTLHYSDPVLMDEIGRRGNLSCIEIYTVTEERYLSGFRQDAFISNTVRLYRDSHEIVCSCMEFKTGYPTGKLCGHIARVLNFLRLPTAAIVQTASEASKEDEDLPLVQRQARDLVAALESAEWQHRAAKLLSRIDLLESRFI